MENNSSPSQSLGVVIGIRVGVGASSFLSVLGASLVIATYAAFRDLRTTSRLLLVNLSVADLVVSASHLVGLVENIGTFTTNPYSENGTMPHWLCAVQAAFSVFGTESSILWTIAMAAYLFTLSYSKWPAVAKWLVPVFHIVCWGIPITITVSLGAIGLLGFQPGGDPAFCGILGTVTINSTTKRIVYPIIIGYEVWNYLAFLVLPILYVSVRCRIRYATRNDSTSQGRNTGHYMKLSAAAKSADWKLISIPLIYMLLRVWSVGVDIAIYYLPEDARTIYIQSPVSAVLLILVGVCDSGQGFANGILFCVCTQAVRERLLGVVKRHSCCCTRTCYCGCVCCHVCNRTYRSQLPTAEYESTTSTQRESEWLLRYNNGIALIESSTETSYATCIQAPDSENTTSDTPTTIQGF